MHDDRRLVEGRLDRAVEQLIRPAVYAATEPLELAVWPVPDEPVPVAAALGATYQPFQVGERWGRPWSTSWFRVTGTIPAAWAGRRVEAVFDLGFVGDWPGNQAEALVYDATGQPVKGIAPRNQYVPVANPARGGERVYLLLEAAANPDILAGGFRPTPLGDKATAPPDPLYRMARAELAVLAEPVWHLLLDLEVAGELMRELSTSDPRRHELLRALESALDALDHADIAGSAAAARARLAGALSRPAHASAHTLSAVGHAHIDSAWLWPLRETVRKTARTFANVTALAADYPEFVFACSQAQQYAWVADHYPEIYRRIQDAVKAGQWIPVGGMWVEADGNLPGGEALARQLVVGKRFFAAEFGVDCAGVWLPDSFGYTAAFPQLARLAGMEWFLTQKLSWNQTNAFPHHTFWWEGIDGSQVFTHFPPVDTYNSELAGAELAHAVRNYAEKGRGSRSLVPFGHGDGGGGPTREMLERARRLRSLEGSAKVELEGPDAFFRAAAAEYPDAPVWVGELYLELHRGTYTSQARTKAGNRRTEHLLRAAELWATTAAVHSGYDYPYERLDRLWKAALLNQFHDILPGSSIAWVHREAEASHARLAAELADVIAAATAALAAAAAPAAGPAASAGAAGPWLFNAGPVDRAEVLTLPAGFGAGADGQPLADGGSAVFAAVPASGVGRLGQPAGPLPAPVTVAVTGGGRVLDNGLVRVELDDRGLLTAVRDLVAGRDVLPPGGAGNLLRLYTDLPNEWDAWDIDRHYRRQYTDLTELTGQTTVDSGPLVGAVRITRSFGASTVVQTVRVRAGSRLVEIETEFDWHETEKLVKALFPLDVHADRTAAEIQFGHVFRPTHTNTSWEAARFELCCHRWVHVGEPGYGVGLINDASYGYDASRGTRADGGTTTTVGLSLLRAPRCPDPEADQGRHRMTYALLPGATIADTVAAGYALNLPLRVGPGAAGPVPPPLVAVADPAVVVEAVKLAEDRSGDVVIRLYESLGGRADTRLRAGFPVAGAEVVDLLERPLPGPPGSAEPRPAPISRPAEPPPGPPSGSPAGPDVAAATGQPAGALPVGADGGIPIRLRPFQILTLRLRRG